MSAAVMTDAAVADISARLDRLPGTRRLWQWVAKLSLGGFFEVYDLAFTALMSPLLVRAGVFQRDAGGIFGLPDQANFAFVTMLGLYIGSLGFRRWRTSSAAAPRSCLRCCGTPWPP